jgi:FtsZ-binding cell division protein ZapB
MPSLSSSSPTKFEASQKLSNMEHQNRRLPHMQDKFREQSNNWQANQRSMPSLSSSSPTKFEASQKLSNMEHQNRRLPHMQDKFREQSNNWQANQRSMPSLQTTCPSLKSAIKLLKLEQNDILMS